MAIKVMLVEDHAIVREGLKALLASEKDIEVVGEAGSSREALQVAIRARPEVVIMDLRLPDRSGIEVTRALKEAFPDIKVVILSMYDEEELVIRALKSGATGYVLKRAGVTELLRAIRTVSSGEAYLDSAIARRVVEGLQKGISLEQRAGMGPELTPREEEILRLVAQGLTNQEIAQRLFISIKTVQAHRANLMKKLGVHDRVDLVKYALKKGLLDLEKED
ncbi:two component transcriptional regulator, LuxR family [Thermanaeromonas toyohensis ToBE]|uniref:Stage 0 sporulation protein A homolog n=1 Tax=Thermanaeromonas toyohensis ToBE TaxID=698762 RepID=A0A1W1V6C5_9FIRM|nr:response regulator transcription factor [Thermanaeromonas toyohensis]SMB88611.1 two component transcriptional regulator, LuxR family [Thermanaeromonas toyohensis ToBE]